MAHRWSKWPNSEAGSLNTSIYYAFNKRLLTKKVTTCDNHIAVRTIILRMAQQVSWYFQHTNFDVIDITFLWFL